MANFDWLADELIEQGANAAEPSYLEIIAEELADAKADLVTFQAEGDRRSVSELKVSIRDMEEILAIG